MGLMNTYYTYVHGKRKEDDIAVRKRIVSEIQKSRTNIINMLEESSVSKQKETVDFCRRAVDELDGFANEVDLSEMGHRYPFFSIQRTTDSGAIEKLVGFDRTIIDRMQNVTEATLRLHDLMIERKAGLDATTELKKVRQYISNARNAYKDRRDFIRGLR
ncbi:MAG: hypothetical protein FJ149_09615 [Euryarchaeota archaeon]|nr:hypothetical protein [Euryarchaeota archaeon]